MKDRKPVMVIIVGAGIRSMIYASYAQEYPEEMRIVGAAESDLRKSEKKCCK